MLDMNALANQVREHAGIEVYHYLSNSRLSTAEHNDFHPSGENYRRYVHNLRNPIPGAHSPIDDAARSILGALDKGIAGIVGGIVKNRDNPFEVMVFGTLPKQGTEPYESLEWQTVEKPRKLIGRLGFTRSSPEQVPVQRYRIVYEGVQKLSGIVDTDDTSTAYFVSMSMHNGPDIAATSAGMEHTLYIISNKALVEEVVSFITSHPDQYYDFMDAVLEDGNVKEKMLKKAIPQDTIIVINADDVSADTDPRPKTEHYNGQVLPWLLEKHGKKLLRATK